MVITKLVSGGATATRASPTPTSPRACTVHSPGASVNDDPAAVVGQQGDLRHRPRTVDDHDDRVRHGPAAAVHDLARARHALVHADGSPPSCSIHPLIGVEDLGDDPRRRVRGDPEGARGAADAVGVDADRDRGRVGGLLDPHRGAALPTERVDVVEDPPVGRPAAPG